ncbi:polysaccharide biosynthesis C-terminal domain-containing protein, partial [Christiangramia aquimixticola]|uniref:polysaccharide biosynthesis C-terminal domain-containing protein n=1 Tax=Christiangramia aquimixticola TaxID=1697558 RepID=UPI003AA9BF77
YEKLLIVIGIIVGLQFGIFGLLYSQVIVSLLIFFINAYNTNKFISYSAWEQIKDIFPPLFLAVIIGAVVFYIDILIDEYLDVFRILIGGTVGLILYIGSSLVLKMQSYLHLKNIILKKW